MPGTLPAAGFLFCANKEGVRAFWFSLVLSTVVAAPARGDVNSAPEARLAAAWQALHKGQALPPPCPHPDPIRQSVADFDPKTPGAETALASLRFGVVLLSAQGRPLAGFALACGEAGAKGPDPRELEDAAGAPSIQKGASATPGQNSAGLGPEVVALQPIGASGLGAVDLLLRTRQVGRCARIGWWQLLRRRGTTLVPIFVTEESVARTCGAAPYEKSTAKVLVLAPGALRVTVDGFLRSPTAQGEHGPPEPVHRTLRYRLQPNGQFGLESP